MVMMLNSCFEDENVAMTEAEYEKHKMLGRLRISLPAVCSLVAIRDCSVPKSAGDSTVFPPGNHENLFISTNYAQQTHSQSSSPLSPSSASLSSLSSSSFSPFHRDNDDSAYSFVASDSNAVDLPNSIPDCPQASSRAAGYEPKWWNLGLQVLFSRVNALITFRRFFISARRAVTSILSPYGLVAIFVVFSYLRSRRRLITRQSGKQMRRTIREKDERINQLLSQIAEMNQVLLAMHKGNNMSRS